MATDRDCTANVLDARFNKIAFRIRTCAPDAASEIADYIFRRDREADPGIGEFFRLVHRLSVRKEVPLFADRDPIAATIESRARETTPARRLAAAYAELQESGDDLALSYAKHQVRWMDGCLQTQTDWADARDNFSAVKAATIEELASKHRAVHLRVAPLEQRRKVKTDQAALINEVFPASL